MAMESMQGYTPTPNTILRSVTPQTGRTAEHVQNQQTAVSDIDINEKTGQQAFQVEITQQARNRLAAAASDSTQNDDRHKAVFSENRLLDQAGAGAGAGLIINIVA